MGENVKKNKKKLVVLSAIAGAAIIVTSIYPVFANEIKYNNQISLAQEKLENELFDEAKEHLDEAREYKELKEEDEELLKAIGNLKESYEEYNTAEKLFSDGNYMNAAKAYKKVVQEDTERYDLAIEKKEESIQKYLESGSLEILEKARSYDLAKTELETLQKLAEKENKSQFNERIAQYRVKIKEQQEIAVQKKKEERIQTLKNSIRIKEVSTSRPNKIGGVDVILKIQNMSNKTLSSMSFSAVPYNSAGEIVGDYYGGMIMDMIGPGQTEEFYWSNAWLDTTITSAKLVKIKFGHADGTSTTIKVEGDELEYVVY